MPRIAVDALGGDNAPREVVLGAVDAAADGIDVVLYGPRWLDPMGLQLVEARDRIDMADKPAEAVRAKPDSSLVAAVRSVANGDADAVVSAGNSGAMLAAGLLHLRRLTGVQRPGLAVTIPARRGPSVLLDVGANADARPEHLVQFAHMGSVFSEEVLGVARPEVRLLSIGEEDEKGSHLTLEALRLLREEDGRLNFAGNAEGRDLLLGAADVVVADGFTGNIALKLLEGTIRELLDSVRDRGHRHVPRQARRPADQAGDAAPANAARSGDPRGRLPARAEGSRGDRTRQLLAARDRERDPARLARRRPPGRRSAGRAVARARPCMIARIFGPPTLTR